MTLAISSSAADAGAKVVLVLSAGAPVEIPFVDELDAVLDLLLPGQHGGEAAAALLFGEAVPAGRLTQTWWRSAEDSSAAADYNRGVQARYAESIYVGYRYVESDDPDSVAAVQFPFGHGLSTTTFVYRDLHVQQQGGRVLVSVAVDNVGDRDGVEVVQCYVGRNDSAVFKAEQELRAFEKVRIPVGGSVRVELSFAVDDLAYWDVADHGRRLENGVYEVRVGASSGDLRLRSPLTVTTGVDSRSPYAAEVDRDYARPPRGIPASFPALLGREVVAEVVPRRLAMESRFVDARRSLLGRLMHTVLVGRMSREYRAALAMPESVERDARVKNAHFLVRMMPFTSPRSLAQSSSGEFPYRVALGLTELARGRVLRAIGHFTGRG